MRTAIFVCTGNTCRSPMAEAIARRWLRSGEIGDPKQYFVASAGISASDGQAIAREAREALTRMGIDHSGSTKPLTAEMIRKADLVLCMSDEHVRSAKQLVAGESEHEAKIVKLESNANIEDPIGRGQAAYDELAKRFERTVPKRLKELLVAEKAT